MGSVVFVGVGQRCPWLKQAVCCFQEEWDHSSSGSTGSRPGSGSRRGSGSRSGSRGRSSQFRQSTKVYLVATCWSHVLCLLFIGGILLTTCFVCVSTHRVWVHFNYEGHLRDLLNSCIMCDLAAEGWSCPSASRRLLRCAECLNIGKEVLSQLVSCQGN